MSAQLWLMAKLWVLGMAGVLSLLLLPLPERLAGIPHIRYLMLVQPTVLLSAAVLGGTQAAARVGLRAPYLTAACARGSGIGVWPSLGPAVLGGVADGVALPFMRGMWGPFLPQQLLAIPAPPMAVRLLYGGITEEVLMRWGLMSGLLWLTARAAPGAARPPAAKAVGAAAVSTLLFAAGHLPMASVHDVPLTVAVVSYVVCANSFVGAVAAFLFWRWGLEAAMGAHVVTHLVMEMVGACLWA